MKTLSKGFLLLLLVVAGFQVQGQGLISTQSNALESNSEPFPHCGAHDLMKHADHHQSGVLNWSDDFMTQISKVAAKRSQEKASGEVFVIPVVFHVVYHDSSENLPDSVIHNQLNILNESFRRTNADTANMRTIFSDVVGDAEIEFQLAQFDPAGAPATGITRTQSPVEYFGGILPYSQTQTQQIADWIADSLYYNYFRITDSSLGGSDAWDTDRYLNVWVGDLRIFEPQFNNFEELVFFGLATPPLGHVNWPDSVLQELNQYNDGVLLHYVNLGANNPNLLPAPYTAFNGVVTTGKMLVHEVGHYLGLRHIWGDGDCTMDDFIDDTPNTIAASQWTCNLNGNGCVDNINGVDLPNMLENYMDYSSGDCQNSFTLGQVDVMRAVLEDHRPNLATVITSVQPGESRAANQIRLYPNPTSGEFSIDLGTPRDKVQISILNSLGQVITVQELRHTKQVQLNLDAPQGLYFLHLTFDSKQSEVIRLVKQ